MAWADEFTAALSGNQPDPQPKYPYWYLSLLKQGIPSTVALSIVNNPSYGEGESSGSSDWPYAYRGREQELSAGQQNRRDQPLQNQMESRLGLDRNISYQQPNGGSMPPWNQMSPQQQQMLLQMMMGRGTAGMQFPGANPNTQLPMAGMPGAITPLQTAPGFNPLANQAQNPMMNQQMMQYLMGLQGNAGTPGGMQSPSLAQLLQMRGTGMGL